MNVAVCCGVPLMSQSLMSVIRLAVESASRTPNRQSGAVWPYRQMLAPEFASWYSTIETSLAAKVFERVAWSLAGWNNHYSRLVHHHKPQNRHRCNLLRPVQREKPQQCTTLNRPQFGNSKRADSSAALAAVFAASVLAAVSGLFPDHVAVAVGLAAALPRTQAAKDQVCTT
jgi:hypothetical protein